MTVPLVLVAHPAVYADEPDDLPQLLSVVHGLQPEAVVITMPRGMASPRRIAYLSDFANRLRNVGYVVDHREVRINGTKQRVVVGQRRDRGRRPQFVQDFGQLILANR